MIPFFCFLNLFSQNQATLYGTVRDTSGNAMELVNIGVLNISKPIGVSTDSDGRYSIEVPAGRKIKVVVSFIGYAGEEREIRLEKGEKRRLDFVLKPSGAVLAPVEISGDDSREQGVIRMDKEWVRTITGPTGGVEGLVKSFEGVSSNNELSSQYSVRGGNFDENLVYVNDIEIFRPFLIRNAQQEGLSFINSDMVSDIVFSSGGFDAKYGDKMSSVLDIKYRKPKEFAGNASLSLLGGALHLEGILGSRFSYQIGYRNKTNKYLLNSLETQGEYQPSFNDLQVYLTYDLNEKMKLSHPIQPTKKTTLSMKR